VEIVSEVSISAQHEVNSIIQGLVTKAVKAVYGNEFEFVIKDEVKRNQHETTFYILENGKSLSLDDDGCGGGLCDLVSLVLRVVLWAIQTPRTSPIFVLDEPLKGLDTNRLERAYVMIKELSDMLGVQFIIVTHQEMAIDFADVAYRVTKGRGESVVEQVK
jgi:DNA repair exonuclease SbcCD ATPase subunit